MIAKAYEPYLRQRPFTATPGLFLFTDQGSLAPHSANVLAMPWRTAARKDVHLDGRALSQPRARQATGSPVYSEFTKNFP